MPRKKLTAASVERLKAPESGRVEYFDIVLTGLSLRITDRGSKSWSLMYRTGGRLRRMTIGQYPAFSLKDARMAAGQALRELEDGNDPAVAKLERKARQPVTFKGLVDQFIEKHAKPRQRTWRETERTLRANCADWLERPAMSITETDAYELLDGFVAEGKGHKARVTLAWLKTLWALGLEAEDRVGTANGYGRD